MVDCNAREANSKMMICESTTTTDDMVLFLTLRSGFARNVAGHGLPEALRGRIRASVRLQKKIIGDLNRIDFEEQ